VIHQLQKQLAKALGIEFENPISTIAVMTAQPKYLVFSDRDFPNYVVQYGNHESLSNVFKHTQKISELLPDQVPYPMTLVEHSPDNAMLVQTGMEGRPWFNLRSKLKTRRAFVKLTDRIVATLAEFHTAVASQPDWKTNLNPSQELRNIARRYITEAKEPLPKNFPQVLKNQCALLDELSGIEGIYQHGDFCINNLLVSKEQIGIMDFEHFGTIQMPLHDEFILLRSLMHFYTGASDDFWRVNWEKLTTEGYASKFVKPQHTPGLFLHFILWWILETKPNELRADMSQYYQRLLHVFCENEQKLWHPCTFFDY